MRRIIEDCEVSDDCFPCIVGSRWGWCRRKNEEAEEPVILEAPGKFRSVADMCDLCGPSGRVAYNVVERDLSLSGASFGPEKYKELSLSTASRIVELPCPNCDRIGYLRGKRYMAMLQYPRSAFAMRKSLNDFDWSRFVERFEEKREYYRKRNAKTDKVTEFLSAVIRDIEKLRESNSISDSTFELLERLAREAGEREEQGSR